MTWLIWLYAAIGWMAFAILSLHVAGVNPNETKTNYRGRTVPKWETFELVFIAVGHLLFWPVLIPIFGFIRIWKWLTRNTEQPA